MSDREDFEEAAARMGYRLRMRDPASEDGEYGDRETQCAWDMWQECCDKVARARQPGSGEAAAWQWYSSKLEHVISWLRENPCGSPAMPKRPEPLHPSASVPEGWKLVPIEPTAEMSKAGVKVLQNTNAWATGVYQAMVEAARPTPAATAETDWVKPTGRHHELKTDYSVFQQSAAGLKPWEIRKNDRGFSVGDTVTLRETEYTGEEMADGAPLAFTGRTVSGVIGYVLDGPVYGLSDKWCIFTLQSTPPQEQ